MAFVADSIVKDSVASGLHKDVADLESFWTTIIADANLAAYDEIVGHFLLLGYTKAQIDTWDRGITFQKFIARYQSLIDGAGDKTEVGEWRTELDYWRGKLKEITTLEIAAVITDPADGTSDIGRGELSTSNDIFVLDPNNRGNITEW